MHFFKPNLMQVFATSFFSVSVFAASPTLPPILETELEAPNYSSKIAEAQNRCSRPCNQWITSSSDLHLTQDNQVYCIENDISSATALSIDGDGITVRGNGHHIGGQIRLEIYVADTAVCNLSSDSGLYTYGNEDVILNDIHIQGSLSVTGVARRPKRAFIYQSSGRSASTVLDAEDVIFLENTIEGDRNQGAPNNLVFLLGHRIHFVRNNVKLHNAESDQIVEMLELHNSIVHSNEFTIMSGTKGWANCRNECTGNKIVGNIFDTSRIPSGYGFAIGQGSPRDNIFYGNFVLANTSYGFSTNFTAKRNRVERNVFVTLDGPALHIRQNTGFGLDKTIIKNNVFMSFDATEPGIWVQDNTSASGEILFENNIVVSNGGPVISMDHSSYLSQFNSNYNLFYRKTPGTQFKVQADYYSDLFSYQIGTGSDLSSLYGDPEFSDPDQYDFRLFSTSPAVNNGNPNDTPPIGGGPIIDMGAFEFTSDLTGGSNEVPIVPDQQVSFYWNQTVFVEVEYTDPDAGPGPYSLYVFSTGYPDNAHTFEVVNPEPGKFIFKYRARSGFIGVDLVQFAILDGEGVSNVATYRFNSKRLPRRTKDPLPYEQYP